MLPSINAENGFELSDDRILILQESRSAITYSANGNCHRCRSS